MINRQQRITADKRLRYASPKLLSATSFIHKPLGVIVSKRLKREDIREIYMHAKNGYRVKRQKIINRRYASQSFMRRENIQYGRYKVVAYPVGLWIPQPGFKSRCRPSSLNPTGGDYHGKV